jgi:hypothetical protein
MASNRLFTLLAVMSLALGIGANTAIYSFMDWILMRSLPVQDPGSLVVMTGGDELASEGPSTARKRARSHESVAFHEWRYVWRFQDGANRRHFPLPRL